jgi:hypothetical protein
VANPSLVALQGMDAWLTAIDANHAQKHSDVVSAKPADLVDGCWNATERPHQRAGHLGRGAGSCNTLYPSFADTRISAGAPRCATTCSSAT